MKASFREHVKLWRMLRGDKRGARTHKVMVPREIDVREIRDNLKMSRTKFSNEFGFNIF